MLTQLSVKKRRFFYEQQTNTTRVALFEAENDNGFMYGFTDNYIKVKRAYNASLINSIEPVQMTEVDENGDMNVNEKFDSSNIEIATKSSVPVK